MAAARHRLESLAVEHRQVAAVVFDQSAALQGAGGRGDADPAHIEQEGKNPNWIGSHRASRLRRSLRGSRSAGTSSSWIDTWHCIHQRIRVIVEFNLRGDEHVLWILIEPSRTTT